MDDVLYAALPVGHPLATRRAIALTDLKDEEWMLVGLRGTCADSNIVLHACQEAGFEPHVAYTSDDYFAIQGLVASGMGVALVPGLALASARNDVAVRPLRGRPPYRRIGAVYRTDATGRRRSCSTACARRPTSTVAARRSRLSLRRAAPRTGDRRGAAALGVARRLPVVTLLPAGAAGEEERDKPGPERVKAPAPSLGSRLCVGGTTRILPARRPRLDTACR